VRPSPSSELVRSFITTTTRSGGHVFCSFLTLVLIDELFRRLAEHGEQLEWAHIRQDLDPLCEVEVADGNQTYFVHCPALGVAGKVLQAAGVAIPSPVRKL